MLRQRARRAIASCSLLCLLALHAQTVASGTAKAADLLGPAPPQAFQEGNGEFVPAQRACRLVPHPQLDLWGQVTSYVPTWVCASRGIYADTFYPPLPPRPHY
jgi:hypothetical protein